MLASNSCYLHHFCTYQAFFTLGETATYSQNCPVRSETKQFSFSSSLSIRRLQASFLLAEQRKLCPSPLPLLPSPATYACVQLVHTLTGNYLTVNSTRTSWTEHTCLKVELQAAPSSSAIFSVLPQYKVRSVGEQVYIHASQKQPSVVEAISRSILTNTTTRFN